VKRPSIIPVLCLAVACVWLSSPHAASAGGPGDALDAVKTRGELLWGSDAEGGAPYVFIDPNDTGRMIGFEVELAGAIARELGVKARQVQNGWESLLPALNRGDFDIAMNGIEITPARRDAVLFSSPYYIYHEQLVVRANERAIKGVPDLHHKKVGTLSGSVAMSILQGLENVDIRVYSGQAEPYQDLAMGRLDAVLMDLPIAAYYARPNPALMYAGDPEGEGFYAIAMRRADTRLAGAINNALQKLSDRGELKAIYTKWGLWNHQQERLFTIAGTPPTTLEEAARTPVLTFLPALLKGAVVTIGISTAAMALAILLGLVLALTRFYNVRFFSSVANVYIEIYRGTPLLIQLYILYYGLPNIGISLGPLAAAIIGLGMNYAAYEAEIYRAGLSAVPRGQIEAAMALGMRGRLAMRRVILPQALRITLPPITNDFIALFKDSSLVSVIAMVELTKTYNMLASSTMRFFELGLITALLYFGMSYPLSVLARKLEARLKGGSR
jgi:polar amino acid transport system substrate-binding protein